MQPEVRDVHYSLALPTGARLAERYRLDRPLGGSSAFAITYLAEDTATGTPAVVKEFFPRSLVGRGGDGMMVHPHSPEDERDFLRALRRFVHEGAALAEINHPNLVRARRLVEANGTAYLVMDRHESMPLAEMVRGKGGRLPSPQAGAIVQQLLSALEPLHADSVVHRDVSPRSVHVLADGRPILLDFAARRHVSQQSGDLAPGFAAFEQYGTRDVGPWTDVYAAAALLYYLLTGNAPPTALDRAAGDALVSPAALVPDLSPSLALAVLRGLALLPQQRPHSASELRRQLESVLGESAVQSPARGASQTPTAAELAALVAEGAFDEPDSRGTSLKFAMGGIVVPHEERGAARMLRRLGNMAILRRRPVPTRNTGPVDDMVPPPAIVARDQVIDRAQVPVETPAVPSTSTAPPPAPVSRETREAAPQPWKRPEAAVSPSAAPATPVANDAAGMHSPDVEARQPAPLAALAEAAAEYSLGTDTERPGPRRWARRSALAAAAVIIFAGAGASALFIRNGGLRAQDTRTDMASVRTAEAQQPVPQPTTPGTHTSTAAGAVLQSVAREEAPHRAAPPDDSSTRITPRSAAATRESPGAPPAPSAGTPNRTSATAGIPNVPDLNVTIQPSTGVKIVPPEVLVGARSRLANGEEQSDQGEYLAARRIFRTALQQLDSAAALYPESQALRGLRREIEQADQNALRACVAENELHRKRGEQPGLCQ